MNGLNNKFIYLFSILSPLLTYYNLSWFLLKATLTTFYKVYILPIFDYGNVVWNGCSSTESLKLERLQNYCARIILKRRRFSSASQNKSTLGWLTLEARRRLHLAKTILRCKADIAPSYLTQTCKPLTHGHQTRTRLINLSSISSSLPPPAYQCVLLLPSC